MKNRKPVIAGIIALITVVVLSSCSALQTAVYDQYSYQKSIEIKVEASRLMDKAVTPYTDNLQEIEELYLEKLNN